MNRQLSKLESLLELPTSNKLDKTQLQLDLDQAFDERISNVNRLLRKAAAQAKPAEFEQLNADRLKLYEAKQKTSRKIAQADSAQADKLTERLMTAVTAVEAKASSLAENMQAAREQWLKREGDFDDAMLQIRELEDSGVPNADKFRKLGDSIAARAKSRNFTEAADVFDKLRPKLAKVSAQATPAAGLPSAEGALGRDGDVSPEGKEAQDEDELLREIIELAAEQAGIDLEELGDIKDLPADVLQAARDILSNLNPAAAIADQLADIAKDLLNRLLDAIRRVIEKRRVKLACLVSVENNTDETLTLFKPRLEFGEWSRGQVPQNTLSPGETDVFQAESPRNFKVAGVVAKLNYIIGDKKDFQWHVDFSNRRDSKARANTRHTGKRKDEFKSPDPQPTGGETATFAFQLNLATDKDPPEPVHPEVPDDPDPKDPNGGGGTTPPAADLQASCLITVNNNSESALNLIDQGHDLGDFMTSPPPTLAAGASAEFVAIETPGSDDSGVQGFAEWEIEGGHGTWRIEWNNPEQEKNTTTSTLEAEGFRELDQIGQGDENVPVTFTLSQSGTPGGTTPPGPETGEATLEVMVTDGDSGDPIGTALVEIGGASTTTDNFGAGELTVPVGPQTYKASAADFDDVEGKVEVVSEDNPVLEIAMTAGGGDQDGPREGFTILVKDAETGEAIESATATAGDQTDTTSSRGLATFELPVGKHPYEVSADDYESESGEVEIIEGDNPELIIELTPGDGSGRAREGLTILVKDKQTGDVIESADVTVGDQSDTTSNRGLATVELPVGTHSYEVSADDYDSASGEVDIIEGDNPELVIELDPHCVDGETLPVLVQDKETGDPINAAEVTIGDQSKTTSADGATTFQLAVGPHDYEATADEYESESGSVEVIEGDNDRLLIELTKEDSCVKSSLAVIVVDDETSAPIDAAAVTVGDKNEQTSAAGVVVLSLKPDKYQYEVTKEGYDTESGPVEVAEGDDNELTVRLKPDGSCETATLAVMVLDDATSVPIGGADVTVGEKSGQTSAAGLTLLKMDPGSYDYSVAAEAQGYLAETGNVEVHEGDDNELTVRLKKEVCDTTVTFYVTDQGSSAPVEGATISLGAVGGATGADGVLQLDAVAGSAAYTVVKDGYQPVSGSVEVADCCNTDEYVLLYQCVNWEPPCEVDEPTLRCGDESADGWVEYMQKMINHHLGPGTVPEHGNFDKQTFEGLKRFQGSTDPPCLVDGICGKETWSALREDPVRAAIGVDDRPDEQGAEARWATESNDFVVYDAASDELHMTAFSVGDQPVDDKKATVKIKGANGSENVSQHALGAPVGPSPTGAGHSHVVRIPGIRLTYGEGTHNVEAYLEQELGGDNWGGTFEVSGGGGPMPPGAEGMFANTQMSGQPPGPTMIPYPGAGVLPTGPPPYPPTPPTGTPPYPPTPPTDQPSYPIPPTPTPTPIPYPTTPGQPPYPPMPPEDQPPCPPGMATLCVQVFDCAGAALGGAVVGIVKGPTRPDNETTGADGTVRFSSLEPGDYITNAWKDVYLGAANFPLKPGETKTVIMRQKPTGPDLEAIADKVKEKVEDVIEDAVKVGKKVTKKVVENLAGDEEEKSIIDEIKDKVVDVAEEVVDAGKEAARKVGKGVKKIGKEIEELGSDEDEQANE